MAQTLSKAEQAQLTRLLKDDAWPVLEKYVAFFVETIIEQRVAGNNEFETLRDLHINQGKTDGIGELFQALEQQAFK